MNLSNGTFLVSFEQLEEGLRNWRSFTDASVYDAAGMMALFCACIDNLSANLLDTEVGDLAESVTPQEREFLRLVCKERAAD